MTAKDVLHKLIEGLDPYLSTGVPRVYWDLAITFTQELYGQKGVELLESVHETYDGAVEAGEEKILHSIDSVSQCEKYGATDGAFPKELIEALEAL